MEQVKSGKIQKNLNKLSDQIIHKSSLRYGARLVIYGSYLLSLYYPQAIFIQSAVYLLISLAIIIVVAIFATTDSSEPLCDPETGFSPPPSLLRILYPVANRAEMPKKAYFNELLTELVVYAFILQVF